MREEECKMLIRAIVTSIPHASDIRFIAKEFFDTIGHEVPFKQFGFRSFELYLKSIPDVVTVKGTGISATVSVVCLEKTAHIREMVLRQKQPKKKKKFRNYNYNVNRNNHGHYGQPNLRFQTNHSKPVKSRPDTQFVQNGPPKMNNELDNYAFEVSDDIEDEDGFESEEDVEENFLESVKINYKVPNDVQQKLKDLIDSHPDGMWCSNLPIFYREQFKENLQYAKYGYISIIQMCSSLPAVFKYKQVHQGDYRLYNINANIMEISEAELLKQIKDFNTISEDVLSPRVSDFLNEKLLEVLELGTEIEELKLSYKEEDYMDIIVTEIFDPSKFWFSLMENETKINTFVHGLNEFCKTHLDKYLMREEDYQVGLYCAVKFQNVFHRAKIISVTSVNDQIQVYYIDYGTFLWLPKEQICYLHKSFAKMPAQALRGCLANIQPLNKDTMWDFKATQNFIQLTINRRLVANIQRVQDGYYELIVADTNGPKDIYINDSLVLNGHGLFNHQEQIEVALHEDNVPKVLDIHLYPTFEDLESGGMPNFMELCVILNVGVPYNSIFPKYFETRCAKLDLIEQFKDFLLKK